MPERKMAMNSNRVSDLAPTQPEHRRQDVFTVPEHVRATHGSDGATVLDILHGQMFRLNFAGSMILELSKQGMGQPEIAEQLVREFRIERLTAEADVREFVETLEKHHLLVACNSNSLS
jgi:hypothetical protein